MSHQKPLLIEVPPVWAWIVGAIVLMMLEVITFICLGNAALMTWVIYLFSILFVFDIGMTLSLFLQPTRKENRVVLGFSNQSESDNVSLFLLISILAGLLFWCGLFLVQYLVTYLLLRAVFTRFAHLWQLPKAYRASIPQSQPRQEFPSSLYEKGYQEQPQASYPKQPPPMAPESLHNADHLPERTITRDQLL